MVGYSLINALDGYFSVGIYTSLENVYCVLKSISQNLQERGLPKDAIKSYKVKIVYLDTEPLKFHEFSTYGVDAEIDWNKIF